MKARLEEQTVDEIARLFDQMMLMFGRASDGSLVRLVAKFDLNLAQLISLDLMNLGSQSVSSLAAALQLTPGAVSRMVDHLVKKKLVRREEGAGDRRRKSLNLTSTGRHAVIQLERARNSNVTKSVSEFDPELGQDFKAILERIVAYLRSRVDAQRAGAQSQLLPTVKSSVE